MMENFGPVFPGIPGDFARRVNLDGHDLTNAGTLDNDDESAYATGGTAPLFASLDIAHDEGVTDICSRNNMCRGYRESTVRLGVVVVVAQIDQESVLADVCWDTFELESLETSPS